MRQILNLSRIPIEKLLIRKQQLIGLIPITGSILNNVTSIV